MMETLDRKLTVLKGTKISNLRQKHYEGDLKKFRKRLAVAQESLVVLTCGPKKDQLLYSWLNIHGIFVLNRINKKTYCWALNIPK